MHSEMLWWNVGNILALSLDVEDDFAPFFLSINAKFLFNLIEGWRWHAENDLHLEQWLKVEKNVINFSLTSSWSWRRMIYALWTFFFG